MGVSLQSTRRSVSRQGTSRTTASPAECTGPASPPAARPAASAVSSRSSSSPVEVSRLSTSASTTSRPCEHVARGDDVRPDPVVVDAERLGAREGSAAAVEVEDGELAVLDQLTVLDQASPARCEHRRRPPARPGGPVPSRGSVMFCEAAPPTPARRWMHRAATAGLEDVTAIPTAPFPSVARTEKVTGHPPGSPRWRRPRRATPDGRARRRRARSRSGARPWSSDRWCGRRSPGSAGRRGRSSA